MGAALAVAACGTKSYSDDDDSGGGASGAGAGEGIGGTSAAGRASTGGASGRGGSAQAGAGGATAAGGDGAGSGAKGGTGAGGGAFGGTDAGGRAPAAGNGGTTGGAEAAGGHGGTGVATDYDVLLYRGNGGPALDSTDYSFTLFTAAVESAGHAVLDTFEWPATFTKVELVVLPVHSEPFSDGQVADLKAVLASGGVVLVQNDWTTYAQTATVNQLLTELQSTLMVKDGQFGNGLDFADPNSAHPLMAGVESVRFLASGPVLGCTADNTLLTFDTGCILADEPHGAGQLLVGGDTNFLDDKALKYATQTQNYRFLSNLLSSIAPAP